jgi:hypothetical protein
MEYAIWGSGAPVEKLTKHGMAATGLSDRKLT